MRKTYLTLFCFGIVFYVLSFVFLKTQAADLQSLIDSTPPGGTLSLPADGVYSCNCVVRQSITIDGNGAQIITPNAAPAIWILPNTDNVTLRGLDISASGFVYDIVKIGDSGSAQDTADEVPTNITLDQVRIHGSPTDDSQRGVAANASNFTLSNSQVYEIHGRGFDTQAVCAWNGPGPFRIVNNDLQAAGENILFGGADPSIPDLVPSDIEIRNNRITKPLSWKVTDPSYAGFHWSIKNLLELKNARNVLIDGNHFENSWGDAQIGYAILFTVRNQDGAAPWSIVENVEFSNNVVRNSEQGIQLLGSDYNNPSQRSRNLRVYNNRFEGIKNWFMVLEGFYDVTIEHNTHEQRGNILVFNGEQTLGFVYRNNVTTRDPNGYGIKGDSTEEGTRTLEAFAPGYTVEGNVIAAAWATIYPPNNFYPADLSNVSSYVGTDGLTPGFIATSPQPSPSPSPTPEPTPTPEPQPTPTCVKWNPRGKCVKTKIL